MPGKVSTLVDQTGHVDALRQNSRRQQPSARQQIRLIEAGRHTG